MKPLVVCIIGPSGSGKTSLALGIEKLSQQEGYDVSAIVSYTTRPMRIGETNGKEHFFVSDCDMPDYSEMIAYTNFGGYHYWTAISQIMEHKVSLYVIDEAGYEYFLEKCKSIDCNIVSIYVHRADEDIKADSTVDTMRTSRDINRKTLANYDYEIYNDSKKMSLDKFIIAGYNLMKNNNIIR